MTMTKNIYIYKSHSNILNNIIKERKKTHLVSEFEKSKVNIRKSWKLIGSLIKRKSKSAISLNKLVVNNVDYTSKEDIAHQFNNFFSNIGLELAKNINTSNDDVTQFINNSPCDSFVLKPLSKEEIQHRLLSLDPSKSSPDFPFKLIKIAYKELTDSYYTHSK